MRSHASVFVLPLPLDADKCAAEKSYKHITPALMATPLAAGCSRGMRSRGVPWPRSNRAGSMGGAIAGQHDETGESIHAEARNTCQLCL